MTALLRTGTAALLASFSLMAAAQTVRVAHAASFPPYAEDRQGRSEGMAVDILRSAAAKAGLQLAFVVVPFEELQRDRKSVV